MLSRLHLRVNHATVVAYLALFVALGGSGYAAVTINGSQLKNRSVAGKKLKKDTLTGSEIKESKLGKVKRAVLADRATASSNSAKLGGFPASAYQRPACPAGTELVDAAWIETARRALDPWSNADIACHDAQRRMPAAGELESLRFSRATDSAGPAEWTSASAAV